MMRSFAAAIRRANRLSHPAGMARVSRKAGILMANAALAPLAALAPKYKPPKVGQTLGVVLRQMRLVQSFMPGARPARPACWPRSPAGARNLARRHRSAAGARDFMLYLPASQPKRPKGLILMLHGCNQTPQDFAAGTQMNMLAERHGLAIAWPTQTDRNNEASCWNWFEPGNQTRGAGEPAILASLVRKLAREFGLGRDAVFVAGLSAGGAMAAILADVYPDVFSAAGLHSGVARGAAHDVVSAMAAMRSGAPSGAAASTRAPLQAVRRIVFQGDADSTVHPSNADAIVIAAIGRDATPTRVVSGSVRGRAYARSDFAGGTGGALELWMLDGAGHAWSGGRVAGSYTDRKGPDASAQMVRFFLERLT